MEADFSECIPDFGILGIAAHGCFQYGDLPSGGHRIAGEQQAVAGTQSVVERHRPGYVVAGDGRPRVVPAKSELQATERQRKSRVERNRAIVTGYRRVE